MAIKNRAQLLALIADNASGDISPQDLRDVIDSLFGIAGTMYANDVPIDMTTSWAPIPFTDSIDTKGLTPELAEGRYKIGEEGAAGTYKAEASLCFDSLFNGEIELALTKNGALTPYRVTYSVIANKKLPYPLSGTGNLGLNDTIGLAIKASGNATITMVHGSLIAIRP